MFTHADLTGLNIVATQCTVIELWFARCQGSVLGIDEATTIDADAIWIGNNKVGFVARNFLPPQNLAGVVAIDLIDNGTRRSIAQLWITTDIAPQLRLRHLPTVVQYETNSRYVVIFELIERNALIVWRDDLYHRHPITRSGDHRLIALSRTVRCNRDWIGQ